MITHWILAARLKTLPVCLCPVLLGIALSQHHANYSLNISLILISCVLFIQVGTNYANDYFDFKKGADTEDRVGPTRMTQSGAVSPTAMKNATILMFTLALATGLYLAYIGGWPILLIGLMAVFFGVIYTAGPFALAYIGGAEIVSYLFFGPVSVIGTVYLLTGQWNFDLIAVGSGIGLITSALLVVNNTRDIDTDRKVSKKTWAVRFGPTFCLIEYIVFLYLPLFLLDLKTTDQADQMILLIFLVVVAMLLTRRFGKAVGAAFNRLLGLTSLYLILYTTIAIYLLT